MIQLQEDFDYIKVTVKLKQTLILDIKGIKVDFIRFKYPYIRPILELTEIRLLSIEDIAPMKLDAVSGRGAKKDFFDIYFLLQHFTLSELLAFYSEKYDHETIFHVIRSLSHFEDAETDADSMVFDPDITWSQVKTKIRQVVKTL